MASPLPPAPQNVPETAATYERIDQDNALNRADAKPDGTKAKDGPQTSVADRPSPLPAGGVIAGSVKTEEPLGWDQVPTDIHDPRQQRHPRPDGVGGSEPDSAHRDPIR